MLSFRRLIAHRPIAFKLGTGFFVVSAMVAVVGATGLMGVGTLGTALQSSSLSANSLGLVNTAANGVSDFLHNRDQATVKATLATLDQARADVSRYVSADGQTDEVSLQAIDRFKTAVGDLETRSQAIDQAATAIDQALDDIEAKVLAISSEARTKSHDASQHLRDLVARTTELGRQVNLASDTQLSSLRIISFIQASKAGNKASMIGAGPMMTKIKNNVSALLGAKEPDVLAVMKDAKATSEKLRSDIVGLKKVIDTPEGNGLVDKLAGDVEAFVKLINEATRVLQKLEATNSSEIQNASITQDQATKIQDAGDELGLMILRLSRDSYRYRVAESAAQRDAVLATYQSAVALAGELAKLGASDLGPDLAKFSGLFDALTAASEGFNVASDTARAASENASEAIRSIVADATGNAQDSQDRTWLTMILTSTVSLVIGLVLALALTRVIARPISAITAAMRRLAAGDTDISIDAGDRGDEIGGMLKAVRVFRDGAVERLSLASAAEETARSREERQRQIEKLIADFRTEVQARLSTVVRNAHDMEETAKGLAGSADVASDLVQTAASGSGDASQSVASVASALEVLLASVNDIRDKAETAMSITHSASNNAQASNEKMTRLVESADNIGRVVSLIRAVAEQTNLLALNATIEAARAGEAGRGFAVVASEVKSLANQTSRATDEIATQIADIQNSTKDVMQSIQLIVSNMDDVNSYTSSVATSITEQGITTTEITQNVAHAAGSSQSVSDSVLTLARAVQETSYSAERVLRASRDVNAEANDVRGAVESFLTRVASA